MSNTRRVDTNDAVLTIEKHHHEVFTVGTGEVGTENFGSMASGADLWALELGESIFSYQRNFVDGNTIVSRFFSEAQFFLCHHNNLPSETVSEIVQYSLGSKMVVADRSASEITHTFSPNRV
jgi:hypothetical protein